MVFVFSIQFFIYFRSLILLNNEEIKGNRAQVLMKENQEEENQSKTLNFNAALTNIWRVVVQLQQIVF